MNKKYFLLSLLFLVGLSLHSFTDHYEHSTEEQIVECQACEENVEIKILTTSEGTAHKHVSQETNLISRFVNFDKKSNLSRAPPLN